MEPDPGARKEEAHDIQQQHGARGQETEDHDDTNRNQPDSPRCGTSACEGECEQRRGAAQQRGAPWSAIRPTEVRRRHSPADQRSYR